MNRSRGAGPDRARRAWWLVAALAAILWSLWRAVGRGQSIVNPGGWPQLAAFLAAAADQERQPDFLALTFHAAQVTLAYAVAGTALSLVLGAIGGLLSSAVWWRALGRRSDSAPWLMVRALLALPRAIHEVIWGLILVNIVGLDPWVAILAIAIPFGAITAKVFSELLDEAPRGPLNALLAAGTPPLAAVVYGLLPVALPNLVSYAFYRFECSIRSAAVLGVVGAGGLGHEVLLSFQSLKYREMWTLLYALIALSGLVDGWSALVRRRLCARTRIQMAEDELEMGPTRHRPKPGAGPEAGDVKSTPQAVQAGRDLVITGSAIAAVCIVPLSFVLLKANPAQLWSARSRELAGRLFHDAWPPDLSAALFGQLLRQGQDTLAVAILAITLAATAGMALAFVSARNFSGAQTPFDVGRPPWPRRLVRLTIGWAARLLLLVCRAIPASVWAVLVLFVLFPGVLPGAVALGVYTMGVLGRLMAEVVEGLDPGPLRALGALGASPGQGFAYGALPQAMPGFVSYSLYRWEVCTRESVIVGIVGAAGLGRVLTEQLSSFDYDGVTTTLLAFVVLTVVVDLVGARARRALRSG